MPDLRCPMCGTPMPDTGMRSWTGVGPPDGTMPDPPSGAWRQHGKCPSCGHKVVRNPEAEVESLQTWRVERPLLMLGGTAIMRSTDSRSGSVTVSGGGTITASGRATVYDDSGSGTVNVGGSGVESHLVLPERVDLSRPTWDITCTGFGAGIGLAVMGQTGMVIGGAAAYLWGRRRWSKG